MKRFEKGRISPSAQRHYNNHYGPHRHAKETYTPFYERPHPPPSPPLLRHTINAVTHQTISIKERSPHSSSSSSSSSSRSSSSHGSTQHSSMDHVVKHTTKPTVQSHLSSVRHTYGGEKEIRARLQSLLVHEKNPEAMMGCILNRIYLESKYGVELDTKIEQYLLQCRKS